MEHTGAARVAELDASLIDNLLRCDSPLIKGVVDLSMCWLDAEQIAATMRLGLEFVSRVLEHPAVIERIRERKRKMIETAFEELV
jgi:hypothetical protein